MAAGVPLIGSVGSAGLLHRDWRMLVGGELVTAVGGRTYAVENPATEEHLANVPDAGADDVNRAVEAARSAASAWRNMPGQERAGRVRALAQLVREHAEELALLDTLDGGFPLWMMRKDVQTGADRMDMFADWVLSLRGATIPASAGNLHYTEPVPFGVVGRIIPFNHPCMFAVSKIAAPLVAGNCVVLKPSDQTPLSALRLAELFVDVLPPGVLSIVTGSGPATGDALVRHPKVPRIAFTGSEVTGRSIQRAAAEVAVKEVTLELGGKNAMIVLPDADLEAVVAAVVKGMNFAFAGQSCGSTSRVLLHESVAAELEERVVERIGSLRVGDPLDDETQVGPIVSNRQYERVLHYLQLGRDEGAQVAVGGGRADGQERGYFVAPTVFIGVTGGMSVARDEIFGPIVSLMRFDAVEEAVRWANAVDYGLTGSVWTRDIGMAHGIARQLEAGYVWINDTSTHFPGMPFGGVKNSGTGREESFEELMSYTQTKSVNVVFG